MAAQFKNLCTTISSADSTTFETKDLLTCPVGKTILVRTVHHHNSTTSVSNTYSFHALYLLDDSTQTEAQKLTEYFDSNGDAAQVAKGGFLTLNFPIVLEENDELKLRISEPNQDISLAYVELDTGIKQRYRGTYKKLSGLQTVSGGETFAEMLAWTTVGFATATGTKRIINFIALYNPYGFTQEFRVIINTGFVSYKTLIKADVAAGEHLFYQQAIVLTDFNQLLVGHTWDFNTYTYGGSHCYVSYL